MTTEQIKFKLVHALTAYDRKQSAKKHHNIYALGHYFARIDDVIADIEAGATPRKALCAGFNDRVLDVCLVAIGEPKFTRDELSTSWTYQPVKATLAD